MYYKNLVAFWIAFHTILCFDSGRYHIFCSESITQNCHSEFNNIATADQYKYVKVLKYFLKIVMRNRRSNIIQALLIILFFGAYASSYFFFCSKYASPQSLKVRASLERKVQCWKSDQNSIREELPPPFSLDAIWSVYFCRLKCGVEKNVDGDK